MRSGVGIARSLHQEAARSVRVRNSSRNLRTVGIDLTGDMKVAIDQVAHLADVFVPERPALAKIG